MRQAYKSEGAIVIKTITPDVHLNFESRTFFYIPLLSLRLSFSAIASLAFACASPKAWA